MDEIIKLKDPEKYETRLRRAQEKIEEILKKLELRLGDDLIKRLVRIEFYTPTIEDERRSIEFARMIFEHADRVGHPYTDEEKYSAILGIFFSDIGKSGPLNAPLQLQKLILSIYSKENVPKEDVEGSMQNFLYGYFQDSEAEAALEALGVVGISAQMTLRKFYDLHTKWTLEIIEGHPEIPTEIIPAAVCHHRIRGDNPHDLLRDDDTFESKFGTHVRYGRSEKLVTVLDQYDALRRRARFTHIQAMEKLKTEKNLWRAGAYQNDKEFEEIFDDVDLVLRNTVYEHQDKAA